ncbi:hypothetical protein JCGZ_14691 [Jatropha curcas]|uniref:Uncharacterized protein n=1 Tax=Jatropha curcas TaxID=180498 RepID=A0A067K9F5_JATCU|nr:hypothetical protein JCGZ_14691 [Jatropha curcas]
MAAAAATLATQLRLNVEAGNYSNSNSKEKNGDFTPERIARTPKNHSLPYLSLAKPSWVSNVRKEIRKKPNPPCVVCKGSGRVDCHYCSGKGRTNLVHLPMLPKGEWPKWCRTCGGSGLSYCSRCLGTGEYRYIMGFHFMKMDSDDTQALQEHQSRYIKGHLTAADQLLNGDQFA